MNNIEHVSSNSVEYSLLKSRLPSDRSILFYPGMACNRFGHPVQVRPHGPVSDLVDVAHANYNIIFPEIHMPNGLDSSDPINGLTIDEQNGKVLEIIADASDKVSFHNLTLIGQSLGCLAVGRLASMDWGDLDVRAVLWGPPTLEGSDHRDMLISKFMSKEKTNVEQSGHGVIQFGSGRLMEVTPSYWQSIDENSLRVHHKDIQENYSESYAICATEDNFYPNNLDYFNTHLPSIIRRSIKGESHTLKQPEMREHLKKIMSEILISN